MPALQKDPSVCDYVEFREGISPWPPARTAQTASKRAWQPRRSLPQRSPPQIAQQSPLPQKLPQAAVTSLAQTRTKHLQRSLPPGRAQKSLRRQTPAGLATNRHRGRHRARRGVASPRRTPPSQRKRVIKKRPQRRNSADNESKRMGVSACENPC